MSQMNGRWTIHRSITIHKDNFIELMQDEVTRPDGNAGEYATVRMKPGVCVLPLDDDGIVFLLRQFRYGIKRERIEVISGGVEIGESPHDAARRELREEAGLEARELEPIGAIEMDGSIILSRNHCYIARGLTHRKPARESTEEIEVVSMPLGEAVRKVMYNEIDHAPSALLILKAHCLRRPLQS